MTSEEETANDGAGLSSLGPEGRNGQREARKLKSRKDKTLGDLKKTGMG